MISTDQAERLLSGGGNVVDTQGDKIGSIGQVFLDDQTGEPEWVTAKTGLFGMSESFVPLRGAELTGDDVRVPYDKDKVKDAPRIDETGHLSEQEEGQLYAYYGVNGDHLATSGTDDAAASATPAPGTPETVIVTEASSSREPGQPRLRRYVVTSREQVVLDDPDRPVTDRGPDERDG